MFELNHDGRRRGIMALSGVGACLASIGLTLLVAGTGGAAGMFGAALLLSLALLLAGGIALTLWSLAPPLDH
jgi:hypothetical protein